MTSTGVIAPLFFLYTTAPAAPFFPLRWDGGSAKRAGSGGAPGRGGGGGGTVDICRGWRAQCTGNGVSRRLLVGHYPGILMKCGQFAKGGLWMACWMHGWAEAAHIHPRHPFALTLPFKSSPPFPSSSSLSLYPICPSPRTAPNGTEAGRERMRRSPGVFLRQADCEAIRHLGTAGEWLETHSEQVSSRHGCCLALGELCSSGAAPSIYLALMVFAPQIKWCLSDSWRALGGCLLTQQTEKTPLTECISTTLQHKMPLSAHNHTSKWQFREIYRKGDGGEYLKRSKQEKYTCRNRNTSLF